MLKLSCWIFALAIMLATGAASAAGWPNPPPYSATLSVGEDHKQQGRMYRTPNAYRHELREGKEVVILHLDKNIADVVLPAGFAVEIDFNKGGFALAGLLNGALVDPKPEGAETINGQAVTRYRVSLNQAPVASFLGKAWVTKDGIIMKIEGEGAFVGQFGKVHVEASDIRRGPQPDTLFDLGAQTRRLKFDAQSAATFLQAFAPKK
jgi:hypothetical protein